MSINIVDSETLKASQAVMGCLIISPCRTQLRVIEGNRGQKNASSIEKEIPSLDRKLAETEMFRPTDIAHRAGRIKERQFQVVNVFRGMDIPECVRHPLF